MKVEPTEDSPMYLTAGLPNVADAVGALSRSRLSCWGTYPLTVESVWVPEGSQMYPFSRGLSSLGGSCLALVVHMSNPGEASSQ